MTQAKASCVAAISCAGAEVHQSLSFVGSGSEAGPRDHCRVCGMAASKSLFQGMAFDPDSIVPKKDINWQEFGVPADKKVKSGHLPRRFSLAAFSNKFGWRPGGLNVGQVKLFVERFPQEFRLASLGRIILPHVQGAPFIAPDGNLRVLV